MEQDVDHRCLETRKDMAVQLRALRKTFVALGDETRQDIMCSLLASERGGMRVGEITQSTHLSRPAVSHHLQVLKDAGLVSMYRTGRMNYYYADADAKVWRALSELAVNAGRASATARANGYPRSDSWEGQ